MDIITVKDLVKVYKTGAKVLNGLNLNVKEGEIFSLLGSNGAGKSTLINILTTFLRPTSGDVTILDKKITQDMHFIRKNIACVSQKLSISEHLSLYENMVFQSKLYNIDHTSAGKRIDYLIELFRLKQFEKIKVSNLSGGIKRRLDIVMCMISTPKILFLDEPTLGMDVESRRALWTLIKESCYQLKTTIFLTTHYLEEADILSDSICIIKNGKELVQDTPKNLRTYLNKNKIKITFDQYENIDTLRESFLALEFIKDIQTHNSTIIINSKDSEYDFYKINKLLLDKNINFNQIEILKPSLEDIFISFINHEGRY